MPKKADLPDYIAASMPPLQSQEPAPRGGGRDSGADDAEDTSWMPVLDPPIQPRAPQGEASSEEERPLSAVPCKLRQRSQDST